MKKQYLILLLTMFSMACKKTNDPYPTPDQPYSAISSSRTLNANGHYVLQNLVYDTNGLLERETHTDQSTGGVITQHYTYQGGKLSFSEISNGLKKLAKITYQFAGAALAKMRYLSYDAQGNTELNFERTFEFKDGRVYKIGTLAPNGEMGDYDLYTFDSGNVTQIKHYAATGTLLSTYSYSYDVRRNPYFGHPDKNQSAIGYSRSNILSATHIDHQNTNATAVKTYSYTYNPQGMPTAMFELTSNNQKILTATYSY